ATYKDNIEMIKLLIDYANKNNIVLKINERENNGDYPLFRATFNNNTEIVKLLIDYANKKNVVLKINEQNNNGNYPLLRATYKDNTEIVKLLIDYANKNNIVLKINEQSNIGNYPLLCATDNNNTEIIKLLIDYAVKNNIILKINEQNEFGDYQIFCAIYNNNTEIVELLIDYADKNNIVLEINQQDEILNYYPLLLAAERNNVEIVKLIIDYANNNNIVLKINEQNEIANYYPLLCAVEKNSIEMVNLLIDYAYKNDIKLKLNKKNINGNYPLLLAINNNNFKMIKVLIEYIINVDDIEMEMIKLLIKQANENNLISKLNKEKYGNYLLLNAIKNNNIEMVNLLIKFANEDKIELNLNNKNKFGDTPLINACKKRNKELLKCLLKYKKIDINEKMKYDINALMIACYFKEKDIVDWIIERNDVDLKIHDNKNNFPLHIACYLNNIEIVRSLVDVIKKNKKNLSNIMNCYSDTPLDIAKKYNNEEMIKCLYSNEDRDELEAENTDSDNSPCMINEMYCSESERILNKDKERSICLIKVKEGYGTGSFIEIPIPSREDPMRGLMTNNHVINENCLKLGESFEIYKSSEDNNPIQIKINDKNFVFTSELIDVSFIELSDESIEKINPFFLMPSNTNARENESIEILQYSEKELYTAHGNIKEIHSFNFYHKISTYFGSSGSPLLNGKYEVVGVHKSGIKNKNVNVAVKYSEIEFAIRTLYDNKDVYGIGKARESAKLLSEHEMDILNEYGLKLKLSSDDINELKEEINQSIKSKYEKKIKLNELEIVQKSLFYCTFSENLLFYRTNYVWYVTYLSKKEKNFISKFSLDNIKCLNWYPLISNSKKLDNSIDSKIKGREFILITWLKLTELMYL
ncbi:ankyrin, partial [Neocallimastix sp. 'constans']